jgi:hypothetical protein
MNHMPMESPSENVGAERLRIGLLVDSPSVSKYVHELTEWAQSQDCLVVSHLIVQGVRRPPGGRIARIFALWRRLGFARVIRELSFKLVTDLEARILQRSKVHHDHLRSFDATNAVSGSLSIDPIVSRSGYVFHYRDEDVRAVESLGLDVILRFGAGIQRGEILRAARFGVLSFHHGDNRINRGGPAGFWEVYFRQDSTGFVIQQLTEELDGGHVLFRGSFATKYYYLLNQASLCKRSNFYLKAVLKHLASHRTLPVAEAPTPYSGRLFSTPRVMQQLTYLSSLLSRIVARNWRQIVRANPPRWGVGYVKGGWRSLVMRRGQRIANPTGRFLADPFVIREGDADYCFVEDCDVKSGKGQISAYRLADRGAEPLGTAIAEPFHMSFPFLFRFDSKIYMCPETSEAGQIRLYESVSFPLEWKLCRVLMAGISAVDTMLFERDGVWWLFTNIEPVEGGDYCSQLSIFYADSPLSEGWTPHGKNPIFVDSSKGRNAGMLSDGGSLFRVSQRQGFDLYGKACTINEIVKLTATEYEERTISTIEATFFERTWGVHHLHSDGHVTAFDYFGETEGSRATS